jgi:hypothetical protein
MCADRIGGKPAMKGVGNGPQALAPAAGARQDGGELGKEKVELALEDGAKTFL